MTKAPKRPRGWTTAAGASGMGNGDEAVPGDEAPAAQPGTYDQVFFLGLAAKGKDEWNKWRRDPANEDVRATFAGVDFSETPGNQIDFSGFEFGDGADFSGCKWRGGGWENGKAPEGFRPGRACFVGATFGADIKFDGTNFGEWAIFEETDFFIQASFKSSIFGDYASFKGATFGNWARFESAAFGDYVRFEDAAFAKSARFDGAVFGNWAGFNGATFGDVASFDNATFGYSASFKEVTFGHSPWFDSAAFADGANFEDTFFKGEVKFTGNSISDFQIITSEVSPKDRMALEERHKLSWKTMRSGPGRFRTISFARARFDGEANFSSRSFERPADFTSARFYYPPDFDAVNSPGKIDFTGARIRFVPAGKWLHWTTDTKIPVRLRAFRKIAEETKNHDLERDLYIEERKAERGVFLQRWEELKKAPWIEWPLITWRLLVHVLWIIVMFFYLILADYGRSFVWPFVWWLVLSLIIFPWWYGQILPSPDKAGQLDAAKYEQAVQMVARANAVPFVGPLAIDAEIKKILFCPGFGECRPIPPKSYQWLATFQNVVSIILFFFIGLALRNYFKIK
jgi:Pentapeptide repeats (9 copies)